MPSINNSTVIGWEEVSRTLREFPGRIQQKVVRRAIAAAARAVRDEARVNVPVRTGALKSKIISGTRKPKKPGEIVAVVGIAKGKFYMKDDGTLDRKLKSGSSYRVRARKNKARVVVVNPRRYAHLVEFGSKNNQPSAFMRRAARAKAGEVVAIIEKAVRSSVARELKKR